jgi:hypothetical protein
MKNASVSVVLACSNIKSQVRGALEFLKKTQPVQCVELFLVTWEGWDFSDLASGFASVTTVSFPTTSGLKEGTARAVRMATTDVVVFLEDHTRLHGNWVQRLPEIHREKGADVVGWTVMPFDRTSEASWCGYLVEYGLWGAGVNEGYSAMVPGHNTSYLRTALLEYDSQLEQYLVSETLFQHRLTSRGKKLYLTIEFSLIHAQFLSFWKFIIADFWYGWAYAGTRQRVNSWGYGMRLMYACVIPGKLIVRWVNLARAHRDPAVFPRSVVTRNIPGITLGFLSGVLGEICGYIFGTRGSQVRLTEYEVGFDRNLL